MFWCPHHYWYSPLGSVHCMLYVMQKVNKLSSREEILYILVFPSMSNATWLHPDCSNSLVECPQICSHKKHAYTMAKQHAKSLNNCKNTITCKSVTTYRQPSKHINNKSVVVLKLCGTWLWNINPFKQITNHYISYFGTSMYT